MNIETFEIVNAKIETHDTEKSITHFISTPHIDRGNDRVEPLGVDYSDFLKTRTVFYNHNYSFPIGKNAWIKRTEEGVKAKTIFSDSDKAQDIYNLHKEGVINTWSIGFDVPRKQGRWSEPIDGAVERDEKTGITKILKWILLEYSSAPLAMNPNARDIIKSIVKSIEIKSIVDSLEAQHDIKEFLSYNKKDIETVKNFITELKETKVFDSIKNIQIEIETIKNKLEKKFGENLEKKKRLSAEDYRKLFLGEFSGFTGKKY